MRRTPLLIGGAAVAVALGCAVVVVAACGGNPRAAPAAVASATGSPTAPTTAAPAPVVTSSAPACPAWGCDQQRRFDAAAALLRSKPGYLGVVVRDRQTGAVWRAGTDDHVMWTSSTIKLAVATSILERARLGQVTLDATARQQMAAMLAVSDNDAADALWNRYGKDTMLPRFRDVYGMTGLTFVSGFPRYWGFVKCSAEDLARLMSYVLDRLNPADRNYLMGAMRSVGGIQHWGVWAAGAAQAPGTKDGWSIEQDPGGKHWCVSTVGFAGPGARYIVAVMYHLLPGSGSIDAGVHAVSDLVATAFGASTPAPVTVPDPSTGL